MSKKYGPKSGFWKDTPGFLDWFKAHASLLTNRELVAEAAQKFKVTISRPSVESLRRTYQVAMTPDTKRRAYDSRPTKATAGIVKTAPDDGMTPQQRLDASMLRAHIRTLTHKQTFYELVGEKIIEAVREIPLLPPVKAPKITLGRQLDEEQHVLFISDVQAGAILGSQESGGLSQFNSEILLEQVDFLADTVVNMKPYQPNARKIHVLFGGDMVENEVIFAGQTREIDQNVMNQVLFCMEHFARLLHKLLHVYDQVECYVVPGNHGRIGGKPGEHDVMSNFDWLLGKLMAERTKGNPRIKWNIPDTWWCLVPIFKFNFLLVHGDDVGGGYAGIPFYGAERSRARFQDLLKVSARIKGTEVPIIHYMCIGHFSEPAAFYTTIMNGSWPGGTSFSVKRLQRSAVPSQKMWAVHPRWGLTWMRDIVLRKLP